MQTREVNFSNLGLQKLKTLIKASSVRFSIVVTWNILIKYLTFLEQF